MKKIYRTALWLLCRKAGVEADIRAQQRIETSIQLNKCGDFFANGIGGKNLAVADALRLYGQALMETNNPDVGQIRFFVLLNQQKREGENNG